MRDLLVEELGQVYGAGGKGKYCKPPKPPKCKGGSGSGKKGKGKGSSKRWGKGGSS